MFSAVELNFTSGVSSWCKLGKNLWSILDLPDENAKTWGPRLSAAGASDVTRFEAPACKTKQAASLYIRLLHLGTGPHPTAITSAPLYQTKWRSVCSVIGRCSGVFLRSPSLGSGPVNAEAKVEQFSPDHKLTNFPYTDARTHSQARAGHLKESQEINCFQRQTKLSSREHLTYLCGTTKLLSNNSLASKHKNQ